MKTTLIIVLPAYIRDVKTLLRAGVVISHQLHPADPVSEFFYGDVCFQNHLTKSYKGKTADSKNISICSQRRKCHSCKKLLVGLKKQQEHECGYLECPSCHEYIEVANHKCFIQIPKTPQEVAEERKEQKRKRKRKRRAEAEAEANGDDDDDDDDDDDEDDEEPPILVFFDIEAMQDTVKHIPNLLIAETEDDNCPLHFKGENCIRDFLEWLDTLTEEDTRNVTVVAHNFCGYDSYFVVEEYRRQHRVLNQIRNGAKLLQLTFDNINFIDSLSFFQMSLSAFPKTFGLTELKKGYFPHLFNTPENQDYVGAIPDKEFYMCQSMTVNGRKDFEEWHDKKRAENAVFDFQKELLEYCESDVKLLKEGCLTFKRLFEKETKFDPFNHITIASACNRDLRQNRMETNTIASEPLYGWRLKTNQSKVAMEYLLWQRSQINGRIQHVGNDGEYRIPCSRYTADGFDATTNTVYEFQGCFFHGCRKCYPNRSETHLRLEHRCTADVYLCTQEKLQFLRDKGYNVVETWECDWRKMKEERKDIRNFVASLDLVEALNPRDAFCGGKTNAVKLYHLADIASGEKINYYDFTSLYPFINKNARYPVGHPEIIFQPEDTNIQNYFGIAKVTILPPEKLFHPVLPLRENGKLAFPLCGACVQEEMEKPMLQRSWVCSHSDSERQITGTWCTPELNKAVEKGYKITYIHECGIFLKRGKVSLKTMLIHG